MKIEKYVCDRCGREIFIFPNKPSITLHKGDAELDLCGICVTSFFNWYYKENDSEVATVNEHIEQHKNNTCENCSFYSEDDKCYLLGEERYTSKYYTCGRWTEKGDDNI